MIEGEADEVFDPFDVDPIERMIYDDVSYPNFREDTKQGADQRREYVLKMIGLMAQKKEIPLQTDKPPMPIRKVLDGLKKYPVLMAILLQNLTEEDIEKLFNSNDFQV